MEKKKKNLALLLLPKAFMPLMLPPFVPSHASQKGIED